MKSKRIIWSQSGSPCEKARQNIYSDSKRKVICSSVWAAYNALQNSHPIFNWILFFLKGEKLRSYDVYNAGVATHFVSCDKVSHTL